MSAYLAIPLVQFVFTICLLVLIKLRGRNNIARKPFTVFLVSTALWGISIFFMRSAEDLNEAFLWEKVVLIAIISAALFFYEFTLVFTDTKRRWGITFPLYMFYILFVMLIPSGLVVSGMQMMWYGKAPIIGPLFFPYTVVAYAPIGLALTTLIKSDRQTRDMTEKTRNRLVISGVTCMILGATTDYLPPIGINMYPLGIIGNILFCTLVTIAMLKHGFLEMRTVLRKTTAYSMTSAGVIIFFASISFIIGITFANVFNIISVIILILGLILVAVSFRPFLERVQREVDRWFIGGRYNYLRALQQFSPEPRESKDLKQLTSKLVTLIANSMQSSSVCLLMQSFNDDTFETYSYFGSNSIQALSLPESKLLSAALSYREELLYVDDFNTYPGLNFLNSGLIGQLKEFRIELIIPIKNQSRIIGILFLGAKIGDNNYTNEDIEIITNVLKRIERNVSEAYEYEKHLIKQRDLIDRILATVRNSVLVLNNNFEILLANKEFRDTFQISPSDIQGRTLDEILGTADLSESIRTSIISQAPLINAEFRCDIQGQLNTLVIDTMALGNDETLIILQNITHERERQEKLIVTERLATIGEMAAGLAHEINNPLTGVVTLSELVMKSELVTKSDLAEEVREDVADICHEAKRASDIVKSLLLFARKQTAPRKNVDINVLINNVLRLREYEETVNNIRVVTNLEQSLPEIIADSLQLQQVFLNIVLNAEQAMYENHNGGTLSVTSKRMIDHVMVTFTDDGPGISKDTLSKIFNPFFTTKDEGKGTGLGLSICYGIIRSHRGKIYAISELGHGASFCIELPTDD